MLLISTNGKTSLFDPHKFITNYLNTDLPTIPQSAHFVCPVPHFPKWKKLDEEKY